MKDGIKDGDKIFIAGAGGMVGNAVYNLLTNPKKDFNFKDIRLLVPSRKELNLEISEQVDNWFEKNKPNIVIMAAAKVGGINANNKFPTEFLLNNLKIQNNIIEASFKNNVRRLLFLGSSCIYPKNAPQPIKEEYLLTSALEETNEWYALAKITGMKLCEALHKQYDFDAISLMPTNLYGKGDNYNEKNSHVLPALIYKFYFAKQNNLKFVRCWGSGKPLREFLYVDDLADACIFALNNWFPNEKDSPKNNSGEPLQWLNVGCKNEISIKELAEKIAGLLKYNGEIFWDENMPDGTMRKKLDTTRLDKLGWKANVDIDEGLKKTIDHFKNELNNNNLRI